MTSVTEPPKAPRWISTDAGRWAWHEHESWRRNAANALSVRERAQLLGEAEQLRRATVITTLEREADTVTSSIVFD